MFYKQIESQIIGMKCMFRHQDMQLFGLRLNKYE